MDLDGSLIDMELRLDAGDAAAVARAVAAGVHVVACTGRPFPGARLWVDRLGLRDPFVCYQGAEVRTLEGDRLLDDGVPHALAMEVVRWCREQDLHVQGYRDDRLLVERDRTAARAYARHAQIDINVVGDLEVALGPTTPKLVVVADAEVIERLLPAAHERWRDMLTVTTSLPTFLELTSAGADKRRALDFICTRLEVPASQVVAIGDGSQRSPDAGVGGIGRGGRERRAGSA